MAEELETEVSSKQTLFERMTKLDDKDKSQVLNVFQYTLMCVIPLVIYIWIMKKYLPKYDENKSSLEISVEVVLQLLSIVLVFWLTHRFVSFVNTYSGEDYDRVNLLNTVLPVLFLLLTLETNINKKVTELINRLLVYLGFNIESFRTSKPQEERYHNTSYIPPPPNVQHMTHPKNTSVESPELPERLPNNHPPPRQPEPELEYVSEPVAANSFGTGFNSF